MNARWTTAAALLATACGPGEGTALLSADQNYDFSSTLSVEVQEIAAGQDAVVDWSELSVDQLGKEIATSEVDQLMIVRFEDLSQAEVLDLAAKDCLKQKDVTGVVEVFPEDSDTQAMLSDFQLIGYNVDPAEQFQEDMGTFLMSVYTSEMAGVRMSSFLAPSTASENGFVGVGNETSQIAFQVDLDAGNRLPLDTTALDWAELEVPTDCGTFPINKFDGLMIGRYDDKGLEALEGDFLKVDELADELWTADIEGRSSLELSEAFNAAGEAFPGFDTDSIWLVALRCFTCNNPAPPYLALVAEN